MLPRPTDVAEVVLGESGLLNVLHAGSLFIDMSTGTPTNARLIADRLQAVGIDSVDCPVGRTQEHAEAGTLLLLAGGPSSAVDRAEPILRSMGNELVRCGGPGMGQAMKLVNNMLAIILTQGIAEALAVGRQSGLTLDTMRSVLSKTMAQTAQLDVGLPLRTLRGDFTPGFALALAEKDISLATALASEFGIEVPIALQTQQACHDAVAAGHGSEDIGILLAVRGALDANVVAR
jgi:4-hydroxybutyrate dehydrogenase/sulfolactaldehyde 3-reductase